MSRPTRPSRRDRLLSKATTGFLILTLLVVAHFLFAPTYGAQLGPRSLQLSSNEISDTSDYMLSFSLSTAGPLGSIVIQFCSNGPLISDPCTAPVGFTAASAVLAAQTGATGFTISNASTANQLVLTRTVAPALTGPATYHFTGVTNPSDPGSYYVRIQTFATTDASGPASDYGGIAFAITNALVINAEVPPYLIFCTGVTIGSLNCANATGDFVNFGELSPQQAKTGSSQVLIATNAVNGYNVTVNGTTLTSGNNAIAALATNDVSRPGTGQFGFNLRANAAPPNGNNPVGPGTSTPQPNYNQPNVYRFMTGDTIITNPVPDDVRVYTASYIANVPAVQAPGTYVSTLTYICLANF